MPDKTEAAARLLDELAAREELKGTRYKPQAYSRAARNLRQLDEGIEVLHEQGRLREVDGVGEAIASKLEEFLETGTMETLERLREEVPVDVVTLGEIQGLGLKKLKALYEKLGITTLDELEQAASKGAIERMKGFGAKTQERLLAEIERVRAALVAWRLDQADALAEQLSRELELAPPFSQIAIAGAVRRRCPLVDGVVLVAATRDRTAATKRFAEHDHVLEITGQEGRETHAELSGGIPGTLVLAETDRFGTALIEHTGHRDHVEALMERAGGALPIAASEAEAYKAFRLPVIPAELREGLGEIEAAEAKKLPKLVTLEDIRGDLQMHTVYSDGATSVREMAEKAQELGYDYLLITDHGPSLTIAGAPGLEELAEQGEEIEALNASGELDVQVLAGVEANVTAFGLDVPPEVCQRLDLVVASLHDTLPDATDRLVRAIETHPVDIVGHPSNRLLLKRDGNELDMDRIVEACQQHDVALEINAQPSRLDLDWRLAHRYRGQVPFILSTDAHSPRGMAYMAYAVDQARKAWLTQDDVLNAQPLDTLMKRLRGPKRG